MATTPSIRVVKEFTYRGVTRRFSNRYHFDGGDPPDSTRWTTLSDAIVTAEKACYVSFASVGARIVQTIGYAGGSEIPVFTKTYSTDGTMAFTSASYTPGDTAALVRLSTADRSSKNHPVYLFSYHHAALTQTTVNADTLNTVQKNALSTYHSSWVTGFSDGTATHKRCRPGSTSLATGVFVEPLLTHRDLPR